MTRIIQLYWWPNGAWIPPRIRIEDAPAHALKRLLDNLGPIPKRTE